MIFGYVPPEYVNDEIRELLAPAVKRGGNDWAEVNSMLADMRAQCWMAMDDKPRMAVVTRMDGDVGEIWLLGGNNRKDWLHFLPTLEAGLRGGGAVKGRLTGRKGWKRVLAPFGWVCDGEDRVTDLAQ